MGMAYPNAWKLLESMNGHFREPLVTRIVGGPRGGGAMLTPTGRAVLAIFRAVETKARIMFESDINALNLLLAPLPVHQEVACEPIESGIGSDECAVKKRGGTGRQRNRRSDPPAEG
jgi:molybdate transport system regulatory protein